MFDERYDKSNDRNLEYNKRCFCHQYGYCDVELSISIDKKLEIADMIEVLFNSAVNVLDKSIMQCIAIYDMTYEQIAKKLNISKSLITTRLRKYAKMFI